MKKTLQALAATLLIVCGMLMTPEATAQTKSKNPADIKKELSEKEQAWENELFGHARELKSKIR